jgi:Tc5 transposase DNA-binding domain.
MTWIHEKEKCGNPVSYAFIIEGAEKTGKFKGNAGCKSKFIATSGWFNCFLNTTGLQHVVIHGEAASTDIESVSKYKGELSDLANIN